MIYIPANDLLPPKMMWSVQLGFSYIFVNSCFYPSQICYKNQVKTWISRTKFDHVEIYSMKDQFFDTMSNKIINIDCQFIYATVDASDPTSFYIFPINFKYLFKRFLQKI